MVRTKDRKGYTLTEALITVAITGILAAVGAPIMVNMTNFWRQTTARNNIQRDVRVSLDTMNRYLRQAQGGTIVIDQVTNQPPWSRISFTDEANQSIAFYQTGNKLMFSLQGSTHTAAAVSTLSTNLGYIAFTYPKTDDTTILSVAVTMQSPTYLGGLKALQLSIQKVRIMNQ